MEKMIIITSLLLLVLFVYTGNFYNWRILKMLRFLNWHIQVKDTLFSLYSEEEETIETLRKNLRKVKIVYINRGSVKVVKFIEQNLIFSYE